MTIKFMWLQTKTKFSTLVKKKKKKKSSQISYVYSQKTNTLDKSLDDKSVDLLFNMPSIHPGGMIWTIGKKARPAFPEGTCRFVPVHRFPSQCNDCCWELGDLITQMDWKALTRSARFRERCTAKTIPRDDACLSRALGIKKFCLIILINEICCACCTSRRTWTMILAYFPTCFFLEPL